MISAGFVTIDLAGFSISGSGMGTGILAAPPSPTSPLHDIAVRNGSVSDFLVDVDLSAAGDSIVEGLRVFGAVLGPNVGISANGIVKGNIVDSIRGTGISAAGTVTGNTVGLTEIGFEIGQGSTVIGNTVRESIHVGFNVSCPSNLTDNTATSTIGVSVGIVLNGTGCNNTNNVAP